MTQKCCMSPQKQFWSIYSSNPRDFEFNEQPSHAVTGTHTHTRSRHEVVFTAITSTSIHCVTHRLCGAASAWPLHIFKCVHVLTVHRRSPPGNELKTIIFFGFFHFSKVWSFATVLKGTDKHSCPEIYLKSAISYIIHSMLIPDRVML